MKNIDIDIDKDNLDNIYIDINIDKAKENIDINIDRDNHENIDISINIDKNYLENIDIDSPCPVVCFCCLPIFRCKAPPLAPTWVSQ